MSTELHPHPPRHTPGGRGITAADATATTRRRLTETEQPACVIPNCTNAVDEDGQPCSDCLREFGAHLQTCDARALTRAEIADRDGYVHRAYQLQHQLRTTAEAATPPPSPRRRGHRR